MELFNFEGYFKIIKASGTDRLKAKMRPLDKNIKRSLCEVLKYYSCSLNGKDTYYIHLESGELSLVNLDEINYNIFDYIKCYLERSSSSFAPLYLEALYSSSPSVLLKKTDLKYCCSFISLLDDTRHKLKMLVDDGYNKKYRKEEVINYLECNFFTYSKYKFDSRCPTDGFYYKKISDNDFLICSYASFNEKNKIFIFDLFRCTYSKFKASGVNNPVKEPEDLILGVDILRHKKGLDYVLSNPYATKSEIYDVMGNV